MSLRDCVAVVAIFLSLCQFGAFSIAGRLPRSLRSLAMTVRGSAVLLFVFRQSES
ncbi:MAG: hypothetical protein J6V99_06145 [Neisseriaceae bacterium]|nr:hypothetical protein [Neisseriaceae bacterium]